MIQPAMQSLIVDRVPPRERSSALATLQSGWDIGGSGGAFAFGPLGAVTGAAATFAIAGAGTVIGAVKLRGRKRPVETEVGYDGRKCSTTSTVIDSVSVHSLREAFAGQRTLKPGGQLALLP